MPELTVRYLDTVLCLRLDPAALSHLEQSFGFLRSHFTIQPDSVPTADCLIDIVSFDEIKVHDHARGDGTETVMKLASRRHYVVSGARFATATGHLIVTEKTRTAYLFDYRSAAARLFVSPGSWVHIIEFLRALVWELEVARGTLVLHAAAVEKDGAAYALSGAKGAGKTTTLLDILRSPGFRFVSGDKLFATRGADGGIGVTGWPDFPHVGWGTIKARPRLFKAVVRDLGLVPSDNPREKVVLPHAWYREVIGFEICARRLPLAAFVLPQIDVSNPDAPSTLSRTHLNDSAIAGIVESRKRPGPREGWEPYFAAVTARVRPRDHPIRTADLAGLPAFVRTGAQELHELTDLQRV
jgi:hypothetical protein